MVKKMKVGGFTHEEMVLAVWLHNTYEKLSKEIGWKTQEKCRVGFVDLPLDNQIVMLRLARRLKEEIIGDYCSWCGANVDTGVKNG